MINVCQQLLTHTGTAYPTIHATQVRVFLTAVGQGSNFMLRVFRCGGRGKVDINYSTKDLTPFEVFHEARGALDV